MAELERLARRLQQPLALSEEETAEWVAALVPLLQHADRGFRSAESRILYDLQKVCIERERGVFKVDLGSWLRSLGRVPLRRPLWLVQQVMVAKHLRSAARKLNRSRLTGEARTRLAELLEAAGRRAGAELRPRVRPLIAEVLAAEGLEPRNVPERVAFQKIVEELVDRVVEHGYLGLGDLRDTLSQNKLKLPDQGSLWELLTGDVLLRVDRRLARVLDGVYHRGPIYLRWSQRLSAVAFGTATGRFITRNLALPFGGAFLVLEFVRHVAQWFVPEPDEHASETLQTTDPLSLAEVGLLGMFLLLLIQSEAFRRGCLTGLQRFGRGIRWWFYALPLATLRLPWVRRFFDSLLYAVFVGYVFKPALFACGLLLPFTLVRGGMNWGHALIAFLGVNLLLNSPFGRYLDQLVTDQLRRGWRELQIRILTAGLRLIIDMFQWVLQAIEQVVYHVDEWLLFRTGERPRMLLAKAVLGVIWSVVTYVVRFFVTLLIEPQLNPLKHFPVVTVSHKVLITAAPLIVAAIDPVHQRHACQHDRLVHDLVDSGRVRVSGLGAEGELAAVRRESSAASAADPDRQPRRDDVAAAAAGHPFRHAAAAVRQVTAGEPAGGPHRQVAGLPPARGSLAARRGIDSPVCRTRAAGAAGLQPALAGPPGWRSAGFAWPPTHRVRAALGVRGG